MPEFFWDFLNDIEYNIVEWLEAGENGFRTVRKTDTANAERDDAVHPVLFFVVVGREHWLVFYSVDEVLNTTVGVRAVKIENRIRD